MKLIEQGDVRHEWEFPENLSFLPREQDVVPESEFGDNLQGLDKLPVVHDVLPESAFDRH